jgi:hypothetical protein
MPRFSPGILLAAALILLSACDSGSRDSEPAKQPDPGRVFTNLPLPRDPQLISKASSEDALQLSVHTPAELTEVTEFYRKVLSREPWQLVSDRPGQDGSIVLFAQQKGPPLWVRIRKAPQGGTLVDLTGAAEDSAKSKGPRSLPPNQTPRSN